MLWPDRQSADGPQGQLAGMTVLLADDFEPLRQLISLQLERLGSARVLEAENGEQALTLLERETVQLVVSDWDMPRMCGLELLRRVRADARLHGLPFLLLSMDRQREPEALAALAGADACLDKSFAPDHFARSVARALQRTSAAPALP